MRTLAFTEALPDWKTLPDITERQNRGHRTPSAKTLDSASLTTQSRKPHSQGKPSKSSGSSSPSMSSAKAGLVSTGASSGAPSRSSKGVPSRKLWSGVLGGSGSGLSCCFGCGDDRVMISISHWCCSLLLGSIMSQPHAMCICICSDNCLCCHTEIETTDHPCYLTQSQSTGTRPAVPELTL